MGKFGCLGEVMGTLSVTSRSTSRALLEADLRLLTLVAQLVAQAVKFRQHSHEQVEHYRIENEKLQEQIKNHFRPDNMIGNSRAMQTVHHSIEQVAGSKSTVLIRGESGVGKELVAHAIHSRSPRAAKAFVKINCAALPDGIVESELFGHERGAFTGAIAMRDLVPDTPANVAKKIKTIGTLSAVAGLAAGIKFDLYSTPDAASFQFLADTTRVEMPFDTPATVAIASGYDAQAYTKIGRGEPSNISVSCKHFGITEQLARFNGIMGTLRGDTRKEDQVVWERLLYTGFRPQVTVSKGEGNDEVEATAEGLYRTVMAGYGLAAA